MLLVGCNSKSQVKSEIDRAFEVVDEALNKVQSEEYQEYYEKLENSDRSEKDLLEQINSSGDAIAINASRETVSKTYQIEKKIDSIIKELENAYTLDDQGNFNNKKDKTRINRIMIDENKGRQLEEIINTNSAQLKVLEKELLLTKSESLAKLQSNLGSPENESWAEYNFLDMPVVAVIPILNKIRNDATMSRIELLESINKIKR